MSISVTDDVIQRAELRNKIALATRRCNPNAERMRRATDAMHAVAVEEMKRRAPSSHDDHSRDEKMASAMRELKQMMSSVRSKRAEIPGGTTMRANVNVAPVVAPGEQPPPPFAAKTRVLGSVQPFSPGEFDLVFQRHAEGTAVKKARVILGECEMDAVCTIAVVTLNLKPTATPAAAEGLAATLRTKWAEVLEEDDSAGEKFDFAFDVITADTSGRTKLRVKIFLRGDDADPLVDFAEHVCGGLFGDTKHPMLHEMRKALTEVNFSVDFARDIGELLGSDASLLSALNDCRVHLNATFPHAFKHHLHEDALAALAGKLGAALNAKGAKEVFQNVTTGAALCATSFQEVGVTVNSFEAAVGSVIRFLAPQLRKRQFESDPSEELLALLTTTNHEEAIARLCTRAVALGLTGAKLRDRVWYQIAAVPEPAHAMLDPVLFGAAELVESIDGAQLYNQVAMLDLRTECLCLHDLLPTSRAAVLDLTAQLAVAPKLDDRDIAVALGDEPEGEVPRMIEKDEVLEDEDAYVAMEGFAGKRLTDLPDIEEKMFDPATDDNGCATADAEKNTIAVVQDITLRTAAAFVTMLGDPKATECLTFHWAPSERRPVPACGGNNDDGVNELEDDEVMEHRYNVVLAKRRHLEIAQTSSPEVFARAAARADVVVVVATAGLDAETVGSIAEQVNAAREQHAEMASAAKDVAPLMPVAAALAAQPPFTGAVLVVATEDAASGVATDDVTAALREAGFATAPEILRVGKVEDPATANAVLERIADLVQQGGADKGIKSSAPWDFY